jgi:hypothetical protein
MLVPKCAFLSYFHSPSGGFGLTLGLVLQEVINLGGGAVVSDNGEALVVHVQDQVLAL